jgi:hypothetical protein
MTVRAPIIGTDTDSAETFRQAMSGLWVPTSATNVRTGVTSVPTLTGTGNFTATVSPFTMVIDGTSNVLQAGYPVANDSAATITVTAANTQPRIDLISLQIQDNAYDGSGFSQGHFVVTAGTPAGSPVAPATPANAIPLWTVPVAANATSVVFSSATAVFPFTAAAGGIVYVRGATDKPAVANGVQYRHRGDVTATSGGTSPLESSTDGVTWTPVATAGPQLIGSVILSATAAAMTITIPAGINHLEGVWTARLDSSSGISSVGMQLNGDTGADYTWQQLNGSNSSASALNNGAATTLTRVGFAPDTSASASYFGNGRFSIGNIQSAVYKPISASNSAPQSASVGSVSQLGGLWQSTAVVTSVKLVPSGLASNFLAGSSMSIYGWV